MSGLDREQIRAIGALCSLHPVPAQHVIFEEGERCAGLWILISGRVRLHHAMADGRQHIIGFRAPTVPLELSSALDGRPYLSTATAIDDVTLVLVPRRALSSFAARYPITIRNAIDLLCLEVRQREIATVIASVKDARGRIGCTLLQLARQFGVPNGSSTKIAYRLTRQDIADRSGVTIETAIRVLSDLQHQGIIRTQAQVIEILDLDGLRDPTECGDCQFDCSVFKSPPALIRR